MALAAPAQRVDMSATLSSLEPLGADEYFVAFGPGGRQFCGSPNGYSVCHLPAQMVKCLSTGRVKKVLWASFGTEAHSWFVLYEKRDQSPAYHIGKAIPAELRQFIEYVWTLSSRGQKLSLRVQLGSNGSYVAWTDRLWVGNNIPKALQCVLRIESAEFLECGGLAVGLLNHDFLANVAWHDNGSYYVKGSGDVYWFRSEIMENGWDALWRELPKTLFPNSEPAELAYVGIDPHSVDGDSFVFIKKQKTGKEADFVLRFAPEDMISRITPREEFVNRESSQRLEFVGTPQQNFTWAWSKRQGRPHPTDTWELSLRKGEKLKVLQDVGNDWWFAENEQGKKGWVHNSALAFRTHPALKSSEDLYAQFIEETTTAINSGVLRSFPDFSRYVSDCAEAICEPFKQDSTGPGICAHDLEKLLRGSGCYSHEFLKDERNRWHPDKFTRVCHPDHREELNKKAECIFVLIGILMDRLKGPSEVPGTN